MLAQYLAYLMVSILLYNYYLGQLRINCQPLGGGGVERRFFGAWALCPIPLAKEGTFFLRPVLRRFGVASSSTGNIEFLGPVGG